MSTSVVVALKLATPRLSIFWFRDFGGMVSHGGLSVRLVICINVLYVHRAHAISVSVYVVCVCLEQNYLLMH